MERVKAASPDTFRNVWTSIVKQIKVHLTVSKVVISTLVAFVLDTGVSEEVVKG